MTNSTETEKDLGIIEDIIFKGNGHKYTEKEKHLSFENVQIILDNYYDTLDALKINSDIIN